MKLASNRLLATSLQQFFTIYKLSIVMKVLKWCLVVLFLDWKMLLMFSVSSLSCSLFCFIVSWIQGKMLHFKKQTLFISTVFSRFEMFDDLEILCIRSSIIKGSLKDSCYSYIVEFKYAWLDSSIFHWNTVFCIFFYFISYRRTVA